MVAQHAAGSVHIPGSRAGWSGAGTGNGGLGHVISCPSPRQGVRGPHSGPGSTSIRTKPTTHRDTTRSAHRVVDFGWPQEPIPSRDPRLGDRWGRLTTMRPDPSGSRESRLGAPQLSGAGTGNRGPGTSGQMSQLATGCPRSRQRPRIGQHPDETGHLPDVAGSGSRVVDFGSSEAGFPTRFDNSTPTIPAVHDPFTVAAQSTTRSPGRPDPRSADGGCPIQVSFTVIVQVGVTIRVSCSGIAASFPGRGGVGQGSKIREADAEGALDARRHD
jgi:hypothetical protein